MITKVKLTLFFLNEKNKNGELHVSKKTGKPYKICFIGYQSIIEGDMVIGKASCCIFDDLTEELVKNWKIGDEIEIVLKKNGEYLNFTLPDKLDEIKTEVNNFSTRVDKLETFHKKLKTEVNDFIIRVNNFATRVDKLETEVNNLKNENNKL